MPTERPAPPLPASNIVPACLADALEHIADGVLAVDTLHHITYVNQALTRLLGVAREALIGQPLGSAFPDLVGTVFEEHLTAAVTAQEPVTFEASIAGRGLWLRVRVAPAAEGLAIYLTDMTEAKCQEHECRASEATLQAFLDASPDAAILLDRAGMVQDINRMALQRMGTTRDALVGTDGYAVLPPELATTLRACNEAVMRSGERACFEDRRGTSVYENMVVPVRDAQGVVTRLAIFSRDITAQRQAEAERERLLEALEQKSARLHTILDTMPVGIYIADATGAIVESNARARQIWCGSLLPDSIEHYQAYHAWWPDTGEPLQPTDWPLARAVLYGETQHGTLINIQRFDGTPGAILANTAPLRDAHGAITGAVCIIQDVTAIREADQALRDQITFLNLVTESIPQYLFWKDADSVYQGCNALFAHAAGLAHPTEIIGKTDHNLGWKREKAEEFRTRDHRVMTLGTAERHVEETRQRADGSTLVLDVNKVPIRNAVGEIVGILGIYDDITERKRAEAALRASEERYRTLFESMTEGFALHEIITDEQGTPIDYRFLDMNPAFERLTGLQRAEIIGQRKTVILPDDDPDWIEIYGRVAMTGEAIHFERFSPALHRHYAVYAYQPAPRQFAVIFTDITERKLLVEQLQHEQAVLDAIFQVFPLPVACLDMSGAITRRNHAAELFAQSYLADGHAGAIPCLPNTTKPIPIADLPAFRALQGEVTTNFNHDLLLPDGRQMPLMTHAAPIRVGDEIVAAVIAYQDISVFRELDRAKDEFLDVLSHELQTPLTNMLGFTSIALESDTLAMYRRALPVIDRNAKRQARLISELLDMSKLLQGRPECQPETIDLSLLAADTIARMRPLAKKKGLMLFQQSADTEVPLIADPSAIRTCLEHLLGNSIKFTPAGGSITLTCRREDDHAVLTVTDTGRGIDPAQLPLLFMPFQQVERDEAAGGLGLGLAVVRGYVEWHGGTVSAESPGRGQGSTFTICLPKEFRAGDSAGGPGNFIRRKERRTDVTGADYR